MMEPFLDPDLDPAGNKDDCDVCLSELHPQVRSLLKRKVDLLQVHSILHAMGAEEGRSHRRLLEDLHQTQHDLDRAWTSMYN